MTYNYSSTQIEGMIFILGIFITNSFLNQIFTFLKKWPRYINLHLGVSNRAEAAADRKVPNQLSYTPFFVKQVQTGNP